MATKPLGKGTSNLSVNLPHQALRDELESLAAKSGMKLGPYIRIVLANAAQKGARVAQKFVEAGRALLRLHPFRDIRFGRDADLHRHRPSPVSRGFEWKPLRMHITSAGA